MSISLPSSTVKTVLSSRQTLSRVLGFIRHPINTKANSARNTRGIIKYHFAFFGFLTFSTSASVCFSRSFSGSKRISPSSAVNSFSFGFSFICFSPLPLLLFHLYTRALPQPPPGHTLFRSLSLYNPQHYQPAMRPYMSAWW